MNQTPKIPIPHHDINLKVGGMLKYQGKWELPKSPTVRNRKTQILGGSDEVVKLDNEAMEKLMVDSAIYQGEKGLLVIASIEPPPPGMAITQPSLHVSLSYKHFNPPWNVIKAVKAAFFPDPHEAMMILPRAKAYVNVSEYCFQLLELPEKWEPLLG